MVENNELKIGIGSEEAITLTPAVVKIISISIQELGEKKAKKVICSCKHPDNIEPIHISSVKYENKGKLETAGLWLNLDKSKLIRKGSALAVFLLNNGCQTAEQLIGKEVPTIQDEKGYLCFKAY